MLEVATDDDHITNLTPLSPELLDLFTNVSNEGARLMRLSFQYLLINWAPVDEKYVSSRHAGGLRARRRPAPRPRTARHSAPH